MAKKVATLCAVVASIDAGLSGTIAANMSRLPAAPSIERPASAPGPSAQASASIAKATPKMARVTAAAAGRPGSASRLIVRVQGSYPGVTMPAICTTGTAAAVTATPNIPLRRLARATLPRRRTSSMGPPSTMAVALFRRFPKPVEGDVGLVELDEKRDVIGSGDASDRKHHFKLELSSPSNGRSPIQPKP